MMMHQTPDHLFACAARSRTQDEDLASVDDKAVVRLRHINDV